MRVQSYEKGKAAGSSAFDGLKPGEYTVTLSAADHGVEFELFKDTASKGKNDVVIVRSVNACKRSKITVNDVSGVGVGDMVLSIAHTGEERDKTIPKFFLVDGGSSSSGKHLGTTTSMYPLVLIMVRSAQVELDVVRQAAHEALQAAASA